jgi:hypothetical protein
MAPSTTITMGDVAQENPRMSHAWVARAFFELTNEQVERVRMGVDAPTVGTLIPDTFRIGCKHCDEWWSQSIAETPCTGRPRMVSKVGRNDPCPGGCGRKVKRCACPKEPS